jgi:hypothetical protein
MGSKFIITLYLQGFLGYNKVIKISLCNIRIQYGARLIMRGYRRLLEKRRRWYKKIGKVYCPALKDYVIFNSKGFYHLRYSNNSLRPIKVQMYKLGLLPLVIPVIKNANEIYKYNKIFIKKEDKEVEYWELRMVVGLQRTLTRVILRRRGSGNITFYSVMKKKNKSIVSKIKKTISEEG